ncbi:MAG: GntR family transcriptional regulator [Rhodospirillales bacterium]|nr:GntR family transcriptional regulator [Rhodospirillales bacterium]
MTLAVKRPRLLRARGAVSAPRPNRGASRETRKRKGKNDSLARVFGRSRVPLYIQLAGLLRRRIEGGAFAAGQKLPTLEGLEREFQVARVTVRQAVELLQKEGLVWSQQGKGTFVSREVPERRWLRLATDLDSLCRIIAVNVPKFVAVTNPPPLPRLGPGDGRHAPAGYQYLRSVQYRAGEPFAVVSVHLDRAIYNRAPEDFRAHTALPILVRQERANIRTAYNTVTVGGADPETSEYLRVALNAPTAEVHCAVVTFAGIAIYVADMVYRGDCVRLDIDLLAGGEK